MPAALAFPTRQTSCIPQSPALLWYWLQFAAWKASLCLQFAHPKLMGGFQIYFRFHPKCQDFRIFSDILKFQDSVTYLLKSKIYWCFCEKLALLGQLLSQRASQDAQLLLRQVEPCACPPALSCHCAGGWSQQPAGAAAFCPHR